MRTFIASLLLVLLAQASPPAWTQAAIDGERVRAWADKALEEMVAKGGATGVVVSVVHGGAIVFEGGYGLADVETRTPAGSSTRVRIGSNTKTFTSTIIAQLMEEGRISSLDTPVNDFLPHYKLPPNNVSPILLRHLLTHTAGYEDRSFFIGADRPVEVPASPEVLDMLRPGFARPVGEQVVYSNFAVAMLGPVIEGLTGSPIRKVMQERLFTPLGMKDTELVVSIDEPRVLARPGRIGANGEMLGPVPFTAINPAIAQTGSIVSTAHDMALYMNAQLGHGGYLSDGVRARLRQRLAANAPEGAGVAMVFIEDQWAGRRTIGHGGNWEGFHSWFTLMPDEDVGVFVAILGDVAPIGLADLLLGAMNTEWASPPSTAILSASGVSNSFYAEFYGEKRPFAPASLSADELKQYEGFYRADRRPWSTTERLASIAFFGADVVELAAGEGGLYLGGAGPWVPQGDGRFMLDSPSRPQMVIRPNQRTGKLVLAPEIGLYTMTRLEASANPKLDAILVHLFTPVTLLGLLTPLVLGLGWRSWSLVTAGAGGAGMIAAAVAGLGEGDTLMTGYYAGHLERVGAFVASADLVVLGSLVAVVSAFTAQGLKARLWLAVLGVTGVLIAILLAPYGGVGFVVN